MEWLLLYPAIGLFWFPWFYRNEKRYLKREDRFNGIQTLLALIILWPAAIWMSPPDWKKGAQELEAEREREFLELESRVRAEARATHRRQIAEFDKELGIEPAWKKAHPGAAMEYEYIGKSQGGRPLRIPVVECIDEVQYRVKDIAPTSWDDEQLARIEYAKRLGKMILNRSLPNYSKGGKL